MSETIESRPVRKDPIPTLRAIARFAAAPLRRRAIRGAAVAERVASSGLPEAARDVVARVVARTRLWRREQLAVADELIAHFADALAAGATAERAVAAFGDERTAAALIRRAKRRARPQYVRATVIAAKSVAVLAAAYAAVGVYFATGWPAPSVDYVAVVNAPALATPPQARGWPKYREALLTLPVHGAERPSDAAVASLARPAGAAEAARMDDGEQFLRFLDVRPGHRSWPDLAQWLDEHADTLALIREGASKPHLGYVLGPGGSGDDPALFPSWNLRGTYGPPGEQPPLSWRLRELRADYGLDEFFHLKAVLAAHVRLARERGDAAGVRDDLLALAGLARQMRGARTVRSQAWGLDAWILCVDELERTLLDKPALLADADLHALAHALSVPKTAADLYDLSVLRADAANILQLAYTDDGHGGGRLTPDGLWELGSNWNVSRAGGGCGLLGSWPRSVTNWLVAPAAFLASASRSTEAAAMEREIDRIDAELARPAWQMPWPRKPQEHGLVDIIGAFRHFASVNAYQGSRWSLERLKPAAERMLARRDAVVTAVALELHRRRSGGYPATLNELPSTLLPSVPVDRITGGPLSYRLVHGRPRLYGFGIDRDDDGGRPPVLPGGETASALAARWVYSYNEHVRGEGDWLLYPDPPPAPPDPASQAD